MEVGAIYPILLFSLPLSGRSPDMTEILLTGTLSLNSINQIRQDQLILTLKAVARTASENVVCLIHMLHIFVNIILLIYR